jgi:hypothetical protein
MDYISLLDLGKPKGGDFGFSLMDRALTYLYNQSDDSPSACQYVLSTNGDNFYSSELGKNVLTHMHAKKDVIVWDFITRYGGPGCVSVSPRIGGADLGSAAFRLAFLKQHKLYFDYLNRPYDGASDGYFIQMAANLTNTSVILRQTLFHHQ